MYLCIVSLFSVLMLTEFYIHVTYSFVARQIENGRNSTAVQVADAPAYSETGRQKVLVTEVLVP